MASLIQKGIIALAHQGPLLESARRELSLASASEEALVALIAEQEPLGKSAKELMETASSLGYTCAGPNRRLLATCT